MTDLNAYAERANARLDQTLTDTAVPPRLLEAMRYATLGGGKRVRPTLTYLAAEAAGGTVRQADATACAIEMIHAYSLVHDDLPSMDDDALRRGRPTCHIAFDEATAILAADALQARAFEIIAADGSITAEQRLAIIERVANAAGGSGMVGGQIIDLASENAGIDAETLKDMHRRKTGALIAASVVCGAICGGGDNDLLGAMEAFGFALGLAFQVRDDILDETGETDRIGKRAGADRDRSKSTFVSTHGLEGASAELKALQQEAHAALAPLGDAGKALARMADFIASRDH